MANNLFNKVLLTYEMQLFQILDMIALLRGIHGIFVVHNLFFGFEQVCTTALNKQFILLD
jgi:hypothetical protein